MEATWMVHTPSGPEPCCDRHKVKLVNLVRFLGGHAYAEPMAVTTTPCNNCVNEQKNAAPQPKERSNAVCRSDGKCQYAIDHDAEKLGHCPTGKCVMPRQAETALQPKGGV
jgi:hypothetical protein